MSIQRFFDRSVTVRRLRTLSGNKKTFQATATVEGHIQSLDREARQAAGILEQRSWVAWFPEDANINEGDRLTGPNGKQYTVHEVTTKDYGINRHKEILMVEWNE